MIIVMTGINGIEYILIPLFSSPVIAFLYMKSYKIGSLKIKKGFLTAKPKDYYVKDNVLVIRATNSFIGISYIDLGEDFFNFREKTPEYFFTRATVLGRLISSLSVEAELRVARFSMDTKLLADKILKELSSLRTLLESTSSDEVLKEREKILKNIYIRVKEGEQISGLRAYLVLRIDGDDEKEVVNKLKNEADEIIRGFSIILGINPRVLSKKELYNILETKLLFAPKEKPVIKGEIETVAGLPVPSYEQGTLDSKGVFLGYRKSTRIPFFYNILKYGSRHIIVVGPTGKGKTTLLATIANRLYARNQVDLLLVDPKGDLSQLVARGFRRLRFHPATRITGLQKTMLTNIIQALELPKTGRPSVEDIGKANTLEDLENIMGVKLFFASTISHDNILQLEKIVEYNNDVIVMDNLTDNGRFITTGIILGCFLEQMYKLKPSGFLRKILAIDEAWRSSESSIYYTKRLVKESRGFGIGLLFSTQTLKDIPTEVLHNFGTSIVFGSSESGYIEEIVRLTGLNKKEITNALPMLGIGQVMIKLPESSIPSYIEIDSETT